MKPKSKSCRPKGERGEMMWADFGAQRTGRMGGDWGGAGKLGI